MQEEKGPFINNNKQNKQKQPRRGKTDWQADKAGHKTYDDEPTQNCKHKKILKGANEEGNEGRQVGQINQLTGNKMGGVKTN